MQSKTIIVTGASRGIGLEVARYCLNAGANVYGIGRSASENVQLFPEFPGKYCYQSLDLTTRHCSQSVFDGCMKEFGNVSGLVHNAGILDPISKICTADLDEWRKLMEINFFSGIELIQKCIPLLRETKGSIVLVSSGYHMNNSVLQSMHIKDGMPTVQAKQLLICSLQA